MADKKLTEADLQAAADLLHIHVAVLHAVAEVESSGDGFLPSGEPVILFEAHIFDRYTGGRFRKSHPNLSSARWNKRLYGARGQHQHKRLAAAVLLDRDAALMATSWGRFQVMGFNWKVAGYTSMQALINDVFASEAGQFRAFLGYVRGRSLVDELQRLDWPGFAYGYNGAGYAANQYDTKLAAAFRRHVKRYPDFSNVVGSASTVPAA